MTTSERTLVVVTNEPPFPANHGGRVDQWSRYRYLKANGWRLALVTWVPTPKARLGAVMANTLDPNTQNPQPQSPQPQSPQPQSPQAESLDGLHSVFDAVKVFSSGLDAGGLWRRLIHLAHASPHDSSRRVDAAAMRDVVRWAKSFGANAVVLDGLYGAHLALGLAEQLDRPLIYRSHNVEHRYMPAQARAAQSLRGKFALGLAGLHLKALETRVHTLADKVWEISADDLRVWAGQGLGETHDWLPPIAQQPSANAGAVRSDWNLRPYDVQYLGNLRTPNNLAGLTWFLDEVWPRVVHVKPKARLMVAGSSPARALIDRLGGRDDVVLAADVKDVWAMRAQARVLVNPVLSGSGMNIKAVEMLFTDAPIVTTPVGLAGFAEDQKRHFRVASDAGAFADEILSSLGSGAVMDTERAGVRAYFTSEAQARLETGLLSVIEEARVLR